MACGAALRRSPHGRGRAASVRRNESRAAALRARPVRQRGVRRGGVPPLHAQRVVPRGRQVVYGQTTETFRRHALPALAGASFSLVYAGAEGGARTLDLIARTDRDFELWFYGLQARPHHAGPQRLRARLRRRQGTCLPGCGWQSKEPWLCPERHLATVGTCRDST
jgi:hypothetical protein